MNLSTAFSSSRLLLVNSCASWARPPVKMTAIRSFAPRSLLDELTGRRSHARGALRRDVQIVEDHHVDAAVERALVRLDVALDRTRRKQRAIVRARSECRRAKTSRSSDAFRLRTPGNRPCVRSRTKLSLLIGHQRVHFDVFDLGLEGRRLLGGRLRGGACEAGACCD